MTTSEGQPYLLGHTRVGYPEMWGMKEVVQASGRSDTGLRLLRAQFADEFPEPVTVLAATPAYVAEEIRQFLKRHPATEVRNKPIGPAAVEQIHALRERGVSSADIATKLGVSVVTVYNHLNKRPGQG